MASVVERVRAVPHRLVGPTRPADPEVAARPKTGLRARLRTGTALGALHLVPLLALALVIHLVGRFGTPRRSEAEGDLLGAAWATLHPETDPTGVLGQAASTLARLEVAGWLSVSGSLGRAPHAVGAGRELMVLATLVSVALVWVLARQLRLPAWAAAVAVVLVAVCPTAVELQRSLSAVGLAIPWVLAAFVLALARQRVPAALVGSTACLVVAGLTEPAALLVLPGLALVLWRRRSVDGRAVDTAAWLLVIGVDVTTLFVVLAGSPTVAIGAVGPVEGPGLVAAAALGAATLAALVFRRLRPLGLTAGVLLAAALLGPGALPGPAAALLVPFGALVVVGVADGFVRYRPTRLLGRNVHRAGAVAGGLVAVGLVVAVAPGWADGLGRLTAGDADRPLAQAVSWVEGSVPTEATVLTGAATRVDLLRQGRDAGSVLGVGSAAVPGGGRWWVVDSAAGRGGAAVSPALREARARGAVAVSFGTGASRVDVLRVEPVVVAPLDPADVAASVAAARSLLENPDLRTVGRSREALLTGAVDQRLVTLLAVLASRHAVSVDSFPLPEGETAGRQLTAVRITAIDGAPAVPGSPPASDVLRVVGAQAAPFNADTAWLPASGETPPSLVLTIPAEAP